MEQTHITQCPKCETTFRISQKQLKAAKGAVRCGACLHVFRASDHFQESQPQNPQPQDDRTADLFNGKQDSSENDGELFNTQNDVLAQAHKGISNEKDMLIDDDNGLIDDDNGLIDDDHSLIDDDGYVQDKKKGPEFDDEFLSLNTNQDENPFFSEVVNLKDSAKEDSSEDESWAQALIDDSEDDESWAKSLLDEDQPKATESTTEEIQKRPLKPIQHATTFNYIQDNPLDLSLPQNASKRQRLIWTSAAIFMLLILFVQVAYFNFNQWARQDSTRPYYQVACQLLSCTLPSSYDVSQIHTTASPQVSTHPRYKNALMIDVLFMNSAQYPQAFPNLELSFSDKNEKVVAHRLFKAREYLAGEAAGLNMMPVQTPVHIALEIVDPGPNANNYQVRFIEP